MGEIPVFTWKDQNVDWEKVDRVTSLVDAALDSRRDDLDVVAKARRLEQFYPYMVSHFILPFLFVDAD